MRSLRPVEPVLTRGVIRGRPNPRYKTLAQRLKLARDAAKLKPGPLSSMAGMGVNAVFRIEKEGRIPGIDVVEQLARVLRVSPGWLAYGVEGDAPVVNEGQLPLCTGMGARLLAQREARALSRSALGQLADVSHTTLGNIEAGRTMPSVSLAEQVAKALGVSPAWLAYGEGLQVLPKPPRRKLAKSGPQAERRKRAAASTSTGRPAHSRQPTTRRSRAQVDS